MTDAEIDAAIRVVVPAEYFAKINVGGTIYECAIPDSGARAIYRAGMLRAAQMITQDCERILATQTIPPRNNTDEGINLQIRLCAVMLPSITDAIERAAGGER